MKKYLILILAVCYTALTANAQVARYYNLFSLAEGSTNDTTAYLPPVSTNLVITLFSSVTNQYGSPTLTNTITSSNIVIQCQEFDSAGFSFSATAVAGTGATNVPYGVYIFGSGNKGATWDTVPRWNFTTTNSAAGSLTYNLITNLDTHGLDRLAFVFVNQATNVTAVESNVLAGVLLKGTKVHAKTAAD